MSASQLGTLLQQTCQSNGRHQTTGLTVFVLSACKSGMAVEGESVFQGTAQNLIYHGVPAVVAMQYSVMVEGAIAFAKQFYRSIGEKNSLAVAVSQGRAMMGVDETQWYRPILYLRWRDNEGGQLFAKSLPNSTLSYLSENPENSFCELVEWISKRSRFLENLDPCYEDKIFNTLKRAELGKSDFTKNEVEILELLLTYWRFKNNRQPKRKQFKSMLKNEDFIDYLRKMIELEKFIRGQQKVGLSDLIEDSEISSLVKILEK